VQDSTGLCRRCGRDSGVYQLNGREADAALIERQRRATPPIATQPMRESRVVMIRGVEFEIVWDGA
jgi:hypothetical protein